MTMKEYLDVSCTRQRASLFQRVDDLCSTVPELKDTIIPKDMLKQLDDRLDSCELYFAVMTCLHHLVQKVGKYKDYEAQFRERDVFPEFDFKYNFDQAWKLEILSYTGWWEVLKAYQEYNAAKHTLSFHPQPRSPKRSVDNEDQPDAKRARSETNRS